MGVQYDVGRGWVGGWYDVGREWVGGWVCSMM